MPNPMQALGAHWRIGSESLALKDSLYRLRKPYSSRSVLLITAATNR